MRERSHPVANINAIDIQHMGWSRVDGYMLCDAIQLSRRAVYYAEHLELLLTRANGVAMDREIIYRCGKFGTGIRKWYEHFNGMAFSAWTSIV